MNINEVEKKYKALANRRRLKILKFLFLNKEAKVGEIADNISLSFKATSKHLLILKSSGFIDSKQVNLEQRYSIIDKSDSFTKHTLSLL